MIYIAHRGLLNGPSKWENAPWAIEEAIADGKKIRIKDAAKMWGIGTPEDLNYFLTHHHD